jgi:Cu/Ag efflux protein CusF
MRVLIVSLAAMALLGAVSAAGAASTADVLNATANIKSLDPATHMVTLDNGSTYLATPNIKLSSFKVGEKVAFSYFKSGDNLDLMWMRAAS